MGADLASRAHATNRVLNPKVRPSAKLPIAEALVGEHPLPLQRAFMAVRFSQAAPLCGNLLRSASATKNAARTDAHYSRPAFSTISSSSSARISRVSTGTNFSRVPGGCPSGC